MPFNSLLFIFFFFGLLLIYYAFPARWRPGTLVLMSVGFYATFSLVSLLAMLLITCIGYFTVKLMQKRAYTKSTIWFGCITVTLILLLFKYFPIYNGPVKNYLFLDYPYLNPLIQPISISFYSLQMMSLLIDNYRNKIQRNHSFSNLLLFVSFFPQSLAGPIHRQKELMPQFKPQQLFFKSSNIVVGMRYLIWGFVCKLIVADKIGLVIHPVFTNLEEFNGFTVFLSSFLYTFQIYFDFYGYSLIAIGLGRMLGIKVKINFNQPYLCSSFREFWRRWHISLSTWFRDYIYIPLGGSRNGKRIFVLAIVVTFLLSGIWHGTSWNFVIWGIVHALILIFELFVVKQMTSKIRHNRVKVIWSSIRIILFWSTLTLTWLIFKITDVSELILAFDKIVAINNWSFDESKTLLNTPFNLFYMITFSSIIVLSFLRNPEEWIEEIPDSNWAYSKSTALLTLGTILLILFGDIGEQEFIYFSF